tara:strand:+ start:1654 stop:1911 length:258 start_codon:yes stop_codon:yes gene_type:complete
MIKKTSRKDRGLGKYDAPLRFQYDQGYSAFKRGKTFNPFHKDTMQCREWERGFNKAYFEQLKRVLKYEQTKAGSRAVSTGEVQHV